MPNLTEVANGILNFLEPWYRQYGYIFVFLGSFFENTLFFGWLLPGGIVTALGGFYANESDLSLTGVTMLAILGATLGKSFDYIVGYFWGKLIRKRFSLDDRIALARKILEKHGTWGIFLTSVVGPLRSVLMLTAGMTKLSYFWFLKMTFLASAIWGITFVVLGYFLGYNRTVLERTVSYLGIFGWILFAVLLLLWLGKQFWASYYTKRKKVSS